MSTTRDPKKRRNDRSSLSKAGREEVIPAEKTETTYVKKPNQVTNADLIPRNSQTEDNAGGFGSQAGSLKRRDSQPTIRSKTLNRIDSSRNLDNQSIRSIYSRPSTERTDDKPFFAVRGLQVFSRRRSLNEIDHTRLSKTMQDILNRSKSIRDMNTQNVAFNQKLVDLSRLNEGAGGNTERLRSKTSGHLTRNRSKHSIDGSEKPKPFKEPVRSTSAMSLREVENESGSKTTENTAPKPKKRNSTSQKLTQDDRPAVEEPPTPAPTPTPMKVAKQKMDRSQSPKENHKHSSSRHRSKSHGKNKHHKSGAPNIHKEPLPEIEDNTGPVPIPEEPPVVKKKDKTVQEKPAKHFTPVERIKLPDDDVVDVMATPQPQPQPQPQPPTQPQPQSSERKRSSRSKSVDQGTNTTNAVARSNLPSSIPKNGVALSPLGGSQQSTPRENERLLIASINDTPKYSTFEKKKLNKYSGKGLIESNLETWDSDSNNTLDEDEKKADMEEILRQARQALLEIGSLAGSRERFLNFKIDLRGLRDLNVV